MLFFAVAFVVIMIAVSNRLVRAAADLLLLSVTFMCMFFFHYPVAVFSFWVFFFEKLI